LVLQWPWQLPMYSYGAAGLPITLKMHDTLGSNAVE